MKAVVSGHACLEQLGAAIDVRIWYLAASCSIKVQDRLEQRVPAINGYLVLSTARYSFYEWSNHRFGFVFWVTRYAFFMVALGLFALFQILH